MARACVSLLGLGVAALCGACQPAASGTSGPASVVPDEVPAQEPERVAVGPSDDGRFVVSLASQCRETWSASLVREDGGDPLAGPGHFEVNADAHELWLRPGDAIVLTSPGGGIMALSFDNVTSGYGARVEVTPECSGVRRTVFRSPGGSADL